MPFVLATVLVLATGARAERVVLEVPAGPAPRLDGKLDDGAWKAGVPFEIRRDGEVYAHLLMLRSGRQLYIGCSSEFTPLALGLRFHFSDPATGRLVTAIVAPLELPRAPLGAWLSRRDEKASRLDASTADIRFDFAAEEGFTFAMRLPLDLLEIGRPKKGFRFNIELWDTEARRALAIYPGAEGAVGGQQGYATLDPVGDWGMDVPSDALEPARNSGLGLLQEIAEGGAPADPKLNPDGEPGASAAPVGDGIAVLMGDLDGKRLDGKLAEFETRLRQQVEAHPDYAALSANLIRVLVGRNRQGEALAELIAMGKRHPSLARDERQALGKLQLLRDSGHYAEAREWLVSHKALLGERPLYAREYAQLSTMADAWKAEEAYRAEEVKRDDLPRVQVETGIGSFVLELFEDDAPNTTANFLELVGRGYYDGTRFHWSVGGASLFGGDPNSRDDDRYNDGFGDPGYLIEPEQGKRSNFPFTIAMVSQRRIEWAMGSNFCINIAPATDRDGRVTVFGRIVEGEETVRKLGYYDVLKKATVIRRPRQDRKVVKRPQPSDG